VRLVETRQPECRRTGLRGALGHEADELGPRNADAPRAGFGFDAGHDLVERRRPPVLDVHRHLDEPATRKREAQCTHAAKASVRLTDHRRDGVRHLEVVGGEIDVEGNQRTAGADEHATGARIEPTRSPVRLDLARVDPPLELGRPATPEQRRPYTGRKLSVEEDGQLELGADPVCERERRFLRRVDLLGPHGDHRHDVGRANARVHAVVAAKIDPLSGALDRRKERIDDPRLVAGDREDGPVVVGIHMDVEEPGMSRKYSAKRSDRLVRAALGEVRDGLERSMHAPYSRSVKEYYDRRAPEYDDWYRGVYYAGTELESFRAELETLQQLLADLPPARTLDVACGTGFLTRHLAGDVTGLDWSERMLTIARDVAPDAIYVSGDALELPFDDLSFDRIFTGHFYGHLEEPERLQFLGEARRVAPKLVVADAAVRPNHERAEWQQRNVSDGSVWPVYKRFFEPETLVEELGGGETLLAGAWFVVVSSP
jgi:ubiquinone/menaquinone biosynthesis C-methylase UbiE